MAQSAQSIPLEARASAPLTGAVRVPGDKSISHRALILGALAVGETRVSGLLEGEDVLNTAKSMRALGATVERTGETRWSVRGVGVAGFKEPQNPLDFGNSGTGCRLVMGAVAGSPITATFDGDASLRGRPMRRILDPLGLMGTKVTAAGEGGRLPLTRKDPTLLEDLRGLLQPATLGDPMRPLLRVSKSQAKLAAALREMGHSVSATRLPPLLRRLGYRRQFNRKTK